MNARCRRERADVARKPSSSGSAIFFHRWPRSKRRCAAWRREGVAGHLVHIVDPAEEDFPFDGRTRFEALRARQRDRSAAPKLCSAAYRARFAAHAETVAPLARRLGWTYLAHRTDQHRRNWR